MTEFEHLDFELILTHIGEFGVYQKVRYYSLCIFILIANISLSSGLVFQPFVPKYRCLVPGCDKPLGPNRYYTSFVNYTIPYVTDPLDGVVELDKCHLYSANNRSQLSAITSDVFLENTVCRPDEFSSSISKCSSYVFDCSLFSRTFVSQWNLTCEYEKFAELPSTLFFSGILFGAIVCGFMSDRYGRRVVIFICSILQIVSNLSIYMFNSSFGCVCVMKVVAGFGYSGFYQTAFVLVIELVSRKHTVLCGSVINYFTTFGTFVALLIAYYIRDWRTLQAATSAPLFLLIVSYWILPESPRHLLTRGKHASALACIRRIASANGRDLPHCVCASSSNEQSQFDTARDQAVSQEVGEEDTVPLIAGDGAGVTCHAAALRQCGVQCRAGHSTFLCDRGPHKQQQQEETRRRHKPQEGQADRAGSHLSDCLRHRVMRVRFIFSLILWFAVNFAFYGLIVDLENIHGDFFLNTLLAALAELPGYSLCWILVGSFGRRSTFLLSILIGGFSILLLPFAAEWVTAHHLLIVLGKVGASSAFAVVYIYTAELFPTPSRNSALGLCSMCGRVAAVIAPQVSTLSVYAKSLPLLVLGTITLVCGCCAIFLPETLDVTLPETLAQALSLSRAENTNNSRSNNV